MEDKKLIESAMTAREKAYAPYSEFRVGAALLTKEGKVYTGCNIENAAYGPSNCAERTAFFKAVSEGEGEFEAMAIIGGRGERTDSNFCFPCGVCRQVMAEFCESGFRILAAKSPEEYKEYTLEELLPERFGSENLKS